MITTTILSIILLATTILEITNYILLAENASPKEKNNLNSKNELQTEEPPKPTKEELERARINNLFSVDIDLNVAREENKNPEIIARMEIPNVFNLLLTQTKDNDYYLDYNIKKQRSDKGNEFIDFRNTITDKQINVYGHNSRLYDLPFKSPVTNLETPVAALVALTPEIVKVPLAVTVLVPTFKPFVADNLTLVTVPLYCSVYPVKY
jgi:hypothetical protein